MTFGKEDHGDGVGRGSAREPEDLGSPRRGHEQGGFLFKVHSQVEIRPHVQTASDALVSSVCEMQSFPVVDFCNNQTRR